MYNSVLRVLFPVKDQVNAKPVLPAPKAHQLANALENLDFTEEMNELALIEIPEDENALDETSENDDDTDEFSSEDDEIWADY